MKVLLFGAVADVVGDSSIEIKRVADTESLRQHLFKEYPALTNCHFQFAVNKEQVTSVIPLNDEDEIAMLPPFAGG